MNESMICVLQMVVNERARQLEKWGEQNHTDLEWLAILMEEVGEMAKELVERRPSLFQCELIQCAAVLIAWAENRNPNPWNIQPISGAKRIGWKR